VTTLLPLKEYLGAYESSGYGKISIVLECASTEGATSLAVRHTPAHPTIQDGCYLKAQPHMEFEGKTFTLRFQHVSGEWWVMWLYIDAYNPPEKTDIPRPTLCLRAQFRKGLSGKVESFGGDFRHEGDTGPLVWFKKIEQD
jgi:hypothetical protein